jgi:hypothetical protein
MKILFVMRHPAAVRLLGSVLREFDSRGHQVHLAFRRIKTGDSHRVLRELADECPGITFGRLPTRGAPGWDSDYFGWTALAEQLRHDSDFLRYLEPLYASAPELRARAEVKAGPVVRRLGRAVRIPAAVRALRRSVELVEDCVLPPPHVERFVADQAPDAVLVTHLAEFGSGQTDYVRAARRLGIHTGYPVFSWDNLTNKGLVHDLPEQLIVWNDLQADEAVELQGIPRDRVVVTGSSAYDHWFDWQPSRSRDAFCREVGLRADRPIVLYVCSSPFTAPHEVEFVRRWIRALRGRGGELAEAGIVVRLHPRNTSQWVGVELDEPQAAIWPRFGEEPLDAESRRNYFDSIYHSAAVVGINTSAQIESAIVGRPVHTILDEEFRDTQQGTVHFHYLKSDDFGHLHVGRTMDEHLDQLVASLRGRADDSERNERFLRRFVRPFGLDVAATPRFVDAVEELVARPAPRPDRGPALGGAVRAAVRPLVALAARREDQARRTKEVTPLGELRNTVRRLGREQTTAPVVAGPWLGDEVHELLYWIPFLRWAQAATLDLHDRLVVVARPSSAAWYEGVGATVVLEAPEGDVRLLPAELVADRRAELAERRPGESFLRRFLEFAPLTAAEEPAAVHPELAHAAAGRNAYVGPWGRDAIVAALSGVPAIAIGDPEPADRRLAEAFLPELRVVADVDAARALLDEAAALAGVR